LISVVWQTGGRGRRRGKGQREERGRGRGGIPLSIAPGDSQEHDPVIAFPNLSSLNRFPCPSPSISSILTPPSLLPFPPPPASPIDLSTPDSGTPSSSSHAKNPARVRNAKLNGARVGSRERRACGERRKASVRWAEDLKSSSVLLGVSGGILVWEFCGKGGGSGAKGDSPHADERCDPVRVVVFSVFAVGE
jgi:hypothetical protein